MYLSSFKSSWSFHWKPAAKFMSARIRSKSGFHLAFASLIFFVQDSTAASSEGLDLFSFGASFGASPTGLPCGPPGCCSLGSIFLDRNYMIWTNCRNPIIVVNDHDHVGA